MDSSCLQCFKVSFMILLRMENSLPNHMQHWIRLEMQPNIAVEWLRLLVDPADSSYMPTYLVVSGGDSLAKMKELNPVRITPSDTWVTILRGMKEVSLYSFTS